jgi:hypothetical protein
MAMLAPANARMKLLEMPLVAAFMLSGRQKNSVLS